MERRILREEERETNVITSSRERAKVREIRVTITTFREPFSSHNLDAVGRQREIKFVISIFSFSLLASPLDFLRCELRLVISFFALHFIKFALFRFSDVEIETKKKLMSPENLRVEESHSSRVSRDFSPSTLS